MELYVVASGKYLRTLAMLIQAGSKSRGSSEPPDR
jgi:hypothetical protein